MTISKNRIKKLEEVIGLDDKNDENDKLHKLTFFTENGEKQVATLTLREIKNIIDKVYGVETKNADN